MAHVPQRIIRAANRRAQRRLRAVLVEQTYNDPGHRTTTLYHQSERLVDRLKGDTAYTLAESADWRTAALTGSYDPSEGESHDPLPDIPLAMTPDPGDHHVYVRAVAS